MTARIYTRLSRSRDDSTSLERQARICTEEAERRGLSPVALYAEREGTSGFRKTVARPEFDRLLSEVESGDAVLAIAIDRLSRQGVQQIEGQLLDRLDELGATLVTLDGVDTSRGESEEISLTFRAWQARQESRNMSRRVKGAADERKANGRWHGGRTPWGFDVVDGLLQPNPETGDIARQVCERLLDGESATAVARWLNDRATPAPRGGTWNPAQISQWATRPSLAAYQAHRDRDRRTGRHHWRPELYRDDSGAPVSVGRGLVTLGEWYRIRELFAARTREGSRGQRRGARGRVTLLGDILACGRVNDGVMCGGPLSGSNNRGDAGPQTYVCTRRNNGRCAGNYASVPQVDYWVGQRYSLAVSSMEPGSPRWEAAVDGWVRRTHPEVIGDSDAAAGDVRDAEAALDRIADLLADGVLDADAYQRQHRRLSERLERAKDADQRARRQRADVTPFLAGDELSALWDSSSAQGRRELLLDVADRVVIHPATGGRGVRFDPDRVEVEWKS